MFMKSSKASNYGTDFVVGGGRRVECRHIFDPETKMYQKWYSISGHANLLYVVTVERRTFELVNDEIQLQSVKNTYCVFNGQGGLMRPSQVDRTVAAHILRGSRQHIRKAA